MTATDPAPVTTAPAQAPATAPSTATVPTADQVQLGVLEDTPETAVDGAEPQLGDQSAADLDSADDGDQAVDGDAGDDGANAEGDAETDSEADESPIDYQFEAPEGVELRDAVVDAYKDALQKHRVDPAVAQDLLTSMLPAIQKDLDAQITEHQTKVRNEWEAKLREQHGDKLGDVRRLGNQALAHLQKTGAVSPEFLDFVRASALAVNPDFTNLLAAFGQRITNDRPPKNGGERVPKPLTAESAQEALAAKYDKARG